METELLRTFVAVVNSGSFTAAARELGYVQSTVTGHLQALERQWGVRVLDRLSTGAVPTEAGTRLLPLATTLLDLTDQLAGQVAPAAEPVGRVRLMAPESLCAYRLPAIVRQLRAAAPGIGLALTPGGTTASLATVRSGTAEAALVLEPALTTTDLRVESLGTEPVALLAAPALDLPRGRTTWARLAEYDAVLLEDGCCYSDEAARALLAAGQPESRRTRFGSIEAVKQLVAAGLGWTILPTTTVAAELRARALAGVAGPPLVPPTVYLVTHPQRSPGVATRLVLDHLRTLWTSESGEH